MIPLPSPKSVFVAAREGRQSAAAVLENGFRLAGLDSANPLGRFIAPGQTVLLKPNLVKESHPRDPEGWRYTITSGELLDAVARHVVTALDGRGTVIVGDGPQTDSSFDAIRGLLRLDDLVRRYSARELDFRVLDLRREEWTTRNGVVVSRHRLPGDPQGYVAFDLGESSEFHGHAGEGSYYGADYDSAEVNRHHTGGRHQYLISATAIRAEVVISLPKLKTHKKAGITAALKNLVGINGDKNWLPHHTEGARGDERPDPRAGQFERRTAALVRRLSLRLPGLGPRLHGLLRAGGRRVFHDTEEIVRSGNWHGNDTIWRTCLDLNKALAFGNPDGSLRPPVPSCRKPHLVVVDGLVAGQGSGPLNPDPIEADLVLFGTNAASVDAACALLMGFDPERIPIVRNAFHTRDYPLAEWDWQDVRAVSNRSAWNHSLGEIDPGSTLHFEPHFGWKGHIERVAPACCLR